jgi:Xaa-Pro aminopeptidase
MNRIKAVRKMLAEQNVDGLLVTKERNWRYLSGFTGSNALLIINATDNYLITDFRYLEQAADQAKGFHIIRPQTVIEDAVVEQLTKLGIKRVGFEDDNLTYHTFKSYQSKLPNIELVPLHQQVEKIRWIKDRDEIEAIKKAADITDQAFIHILDYIKPGVRESEIALELEYFMRRQGAEKPAFDTIVASGPRAALPHGVASDKKIAAGELIVMDFGAVYGGYHSDMTRTVAVGKPDPIGAEIYHIVLNAQEKALDGIKPGVKCLTVDLVARNLITAAGYGANFGHGLGHSVGLEIHEKPTFAPKDETELKPGMVLTVEPGIYLAGRVGVRIEDLVLVSPKGCEILSKSPKQLIEL